MIDWKEYLTLDNQFLLNESLMNCHVPGVHSLILDKDDNGFYTRMFITDRDHTLWKNQCGITNKKWDDLSVAIHPHHCDIEIYVIRGIFWNVEFSLKTKRGVEKDEVELGRWEWVSEIKNTGKGGFEPFGTQKLVKTNVRYLPEKQFHKMKSDELHTVFISKGQICAWIIQESEASVPNTGTCYSNADLSKWTPEGLYQKPTLDDLNEIITPLNIEL